MVAMMEPVLESTTTISQAEFAVWALRRVHELGRRELIRGHIVVTPPAGFPHGSVEHAVASVLHEWNAKARAGRCFGGSQGFELPTGDTLAPDASFVSHERWAASSPHPKGKFLRAVPDLVVEVLSSTYDLREKKEIYAKAGVREYWVVDEARRRIVVFAHDGVGAFDDGTVLASDAVLTSRVLVELAVPVARLFVDADE
jgi:Uma2 family endonuclease